jgi:hypothetical protein
MTAVLGDVDDPSVGRAVKTCVMKTVSIIYKDDVAHLRINGFKMETWSFGDPPGNPRSSAWAYSSL